MRLTGMITIRRTKSVVRREASAGLLREIFRAFLKIGWKIVATTTARNRT